MNTVSVFQSASSRQFLLDGVAARPKDLSIRKLADQMGLSHTLLVLLVQGKRPIRLKHAQPIARGFGLTSQERLYLQALIQHDSAETAEERELCALWLADLHPGKDFRTKEIDEFRAISHWIHTALLALSESQASRGSAETCHAKLAAHIREKVSLAETRAAMERLRGLGLLGADGAPTMNRLTTRDDVASEGAREYHRKAASLAADSLDRTPLDRREFQSLSLTVARGKTPLAKELIRKFVSQFLQAVGPSHGEESEVCQLNIQFFQLTESPGAVALADEGAAHGCEPKKGEKNAVLQ